MAPSACDQAKAEIVRRVEERFSAEIEEAKAFHKYDCEKVEEKYTIKEQQALHDLDQQKLKVLREINRRFEAKLKPIKAKHAEELTAIKEQIHIANPEAGLHASATFETPTSTTLVTAPVSPSENRVENGHKKPNMQSLAATC